MAKKCCVFIDGNNLFHSARQAGTEIDYHALLNVIVPEDYDIQYAKFYTGVDESADRQRGFLHWMRRNNFRVFTKPVKSDSQGNRRAHLECEIVTDLMQSVNHCDAVILVSGDEDFSYTLNILASMGKRVILAGFKSSMANKILDAADEFIELDDRIDEISKRNGVDYTE